MLEFTIHYSKFTIPPQAASRAGGQPRRRLLIHLGDLGGLAC